MNQIKIVRVVITISGEEYWLEKEIARELHLSGRISRDSITGCYLDMSGAHKHKGWVKA